MKKHSVKKPSSKEFIENVPVVFLTAHDQVPVSNIRKSGFDKLANFLYDGSTEFDSSAESMTKFQKNLESLLARAEKASKRGLLALARENGIDVIEKSAYDDLKAKLKLAVDELKEIQRFLENRINEKV